MKRQWSHDSLSLLEPEEMPSSDDELESDPDFQDLEELISVLKELNEDLRNLTQTLKQSICREPPLQQEFL